MRARLTLVLMAAATIALPGRAAGAGIWTPVASGTTASIDTIEYQGGDRLWYVTDDGRIYRRSGETPVIELNSTVNFNDIAIQPAPSTLGLAVSAGGSIYRGLNATWTKMSTTDATYNHACPGSGGPYPKATPPGPYYAVEWVGATTAYAVGDVGLVLRSTDAGLTWTDISRQPDGTCRLPARAVDVAFVASAPGTGYFLTDDGRLFKTTDGLATAATQIGGPFCGPVNTTRTLVLDPAAPQRLFQTIACTNAGAIGVSSDGGATFKAPAWPQGATNSGLRHLAFGGGTLVAVGVADKIFTSPDGASMYPQPAGITTDWRAVGVASATTAAVGGTGGALALTTQANVIPPAPPPPPPPPPPDRTRPTATIAGPSEAVTGQRLTYTITAVDEGGSGIDPKSFIWTLDGVVQATAAATPTTLTHTYTRIGTRSILVTFRDLAGNAGSATKTLVVKGAVAKPVDEPTTRTRRSRRSRFVQVTAKSAMRIPDGVPAQAATCAGRTTLRLLSLRSKPVARAKASARLDGKVCRFRKTFVLLRTRARKLRKVRIQTTFPGNDVLGGVTWRNRRAVTL